MGRFFKNTNANVKDFIYKAPWELIKNNLEQKQKEYDITQSTTSMLNNMLDFNHINDEVENSKAAQEKEYWEAKVEDITNKLKKTGDAKSVMQDIRNFQYELGKSRKEGNIRNFEESTTNQAKLYKAIQDAKKKGGDIAMSQKIYQQKLKEWQENPNRSLDSTLGFEEAIKTPDILNTKSILDIVNKLPAYKDKNVQINKRGDYFYINEGKIEMLDKGKILSTVNAAIMSEPNLSAWAAQRQNYSMGEYFNTDDEGNFTTFKNNFTPKIVDNEGNEISYEEYKKLPDKDKSNYHQDYEYANNTIGQLLSFSSNFAYKNLENSTKMVYDKATADRRKLALDAKKFKWKKVQAAKKEMIDNPIIQTALSPKPLITEDEAKEKYNFVLKTTLNGGRGTLSEEDKIKYDKSVAMMETTLDSYNINELQKIIDLYNKNIKEVKFIDNTQNSTEFESVSPDKSDYIGDITSYGSYKNLPDNIKKVIIRNLSDFNMEKEVELTVSEYAMAAANIYGVAKKTKNTEEYNTFLRERENLKSRFEKKLKTLSKNGTLTDEYIPVNILSKKDRKDAGIHDKTMNSYLESLLFSDANPLATKFDKSNYDIQGNFRGAEKIGDSDDNVNIIRSLINATGASTLEELKEYASFSLEFDGNNTFIKIIPNLGNLTSVAPSDFVSDIRDGVVVRYENLDQTGINNYKKLFVDSNPYLANSPYAKSLNNLDSTVAKNKKQAQISMQTIDAFFTDANYKPGKEISSPDMVIYKSKDGNNQIRYNMVGKMNENGRKIYTLELTSNINGEVTKAPLTMPGTNKPVEFENYEEVALQVEAILKGTKREK